MKEEGETQMNETVINAVRRRLRAREALFGPFMKTSDPAFVEAAGWAGADFVILDMEHGPVSVESMQNNVRAAQVAGTLPIIRVPQVSEEAIGKALDIGAAGVQIPQIRSAQQAREAVQYAKFYPQGQRGVCRFVRAAHYSAQERFEYFAHANETLVILQIEGQEAIDCLDTILEVEGVDIVFIGPYDLSQSLGIPGQIDDERVTERMRQIAGAARKKGIAAGTFTDTAEAMRRWKQAGLQYISYSVDVGIFCDTIGELVSSFHQA